MPPAAAAHTSVVFLTSKTHIIDFLDQFKNARDAAYRNVLKKQQDLAKKPFRMIGNAAKRSLSPKKTAQAKVVSKNTEKITKSAQSVTDVREESKTKSG